jgi:cytochrome b6
MNEESKKTKKEDQEFEKRTLAREFVNLFTLFTGVLYGELDERLEIREAIKENLKKPVGAHVNWTFCFGGISFFLFLVLVVTGILLMVYYRPTTAEAYESVVLISNVVPYGWLIRGLHHWAANLMVLMVIIHMVKVFIYGAYKPPRDFNWVVGVILLLLTMAFGFSGYLLPWNQVSYWATTVVTDATGALPLIGEPLKYFIRGGPEVSQLTLSRFFTLHVIVLPAVTAVFLFLHFGMLRKQGISGPL